MMHPVSHYYHDSQTAYGECKVLVKQEHIDLMDTTNEHADTSILAHDHQASPHNLANCIRGQFHGSYLHSHQSGYMQHKTESVNNEHRNKIQNTPMDNYSPYSSTLTSDAEDLETNVNDSKHRSSTLSTTGKDHYYDSVDLSLSETQHRARREFVPDNKKDNSYWCKRLKNNDSARRSRVKRKALEKIMETKLMELEKENIELKHEVAELRRRYCGQDKSSFDSSSSSSCPRDQTSINSTSLPSSSQANINIEDTEKNYDSCTLYPHDNSHVYGTEIIDHNLASVERVKNHYVKYIDNSIICKTTGEASASSEQCSSSIHGDSIGSRIPSDISGALDLTTDNSNRSTPASEFSSSSSFSSDSNSSFKRYSFLKTESSSLEDGTQNRSVTVFPLKCRWKKEMHAVYMPVP